MSFFSPSHSLASVHGISKIDIVFKRVSSDFTMCSWASRIEKDTTLCVRHFRLPTLGMQKHDQGFRVLSLKVRK
jgi:hypothetical protein